MDVMRVNCDCTR